MKKALTIILAWGSLIFMLSFVTAGSFKRGDTVTEADALPAYEILTTVRGMGLNPTGEPVRRGPYYVLHAIDPRGIEVRVVADAQFGDILSVAPARAQPVISGPLYERGPRIIQVPQAGARASANDRDVPAATNDDDDNDDVAPAGPVRRVAPKPIRRIDTAPPRRGDVTPVPAAPRRVLLSAPPLPAEGPTPIRPLTRNNSSADQAEKFSAPPPPPIGDTPAAGLPSNND